MNRITANIHRDPEGYCWDNPDEYTPEDSGYEDAIVLQGIGHKKMVAYVREHATLPPEMPIYDPFVKEPALYRIFAGLDGSVDSILRFANEYGDISDFLWSYEEGGLSLRDWRASIQLIQEATDKADRFLLHTSPQTKRSKITDTTLKLVQEILEFMEVEVAAVGQNGGIFLQIVASSLLDAMKLQIVEAISEHKRYRTCELCNKPFELTPQVNRSDRMFCSDNCRVKAYQRRKKQVLQMHMEGRSVKQIVSATSVDKETVGRWLKSTTKKEK